MRLLVLLAAGLAGAAGAAAPCDSLHCPAVPVVPASEAECEEDEFTSEEDEFTSAMQVSLLTVNRGGAEQRQAKMARTGSEARNATRLDALAHGPANQVLIPFVTVTMERHPTLNATRVEVHVATPTKIVSTYLLLYLPVLAAWLVFLYKGCPEWAYMLLLPATLCVASVGIHVINQPLAALMNAPMAVTYIQAGFLCLVSGAWYMGSELHKPSLSRQLLVPLVIWLGAAVMYAAQQSLSHLVSYRSSLCERTILLSVCPILSHLVEEACMQKLAWRPAIQVKLGLSMTVVGALISSLQMPELSFEGVAWVCILVAVSMPLTLLQRLLLARWLALPLSALAFLDSALLLSLSAAVSATEHVGFWQSWQHWASNDSILCMLVISLLCFGCCHVCELALLRACSATSALVLRNVANSIVVAFALVFYGEQAFNGPMAIFGIFVSLAGSLWYVLELNRPGKEELIDARRPVRTVRSALRTHSLIAPPVGQPGPPLLRKVPSQDSF